MKLTDLSNIDRRTALKRALWTSLGGAIAYNELALGPSLQSMFHRLMLSTAGQTVDARLLLAEAVRGGPATFRWGAAQALASTNASDWSVVHIKVVNHVSTNLVFRLGQIDPADSSQTSTVNVSDRDQSSVTVVGPRNFRPVIFDKVHNAACRDHLADMGLGKLSNIALGITGSSETYGSKYRMNNWFAQMLHDPTKRTTSQGASPTEQYNLVSGLLSGAGAFDHNRVGLQVALGMGQTLGEGSNHALCNLKIRGILPDFGYYLHQKNVIQSPLGISAFMMGDKYDKAEGSISTNAVLDRGSGTSTAELERAVVQGVSVGAHVNSIVQATAQGQRYVDERGEASLTQVFDKLVTSDPVLRKAMDASKQAFRQQVDSLSSVAAFESTSIFSNDRLTDAKSFGSMQAEGTGRPSTTQSDDNFVDSARAEFLAQVHYVAKCLDLPGKPIRNFSLFLNMGDLDGGTIDTGTYAADTFDIKSLSYVEGMRQLAIGLNILAGVVARHKVLVLVTAEGGRNNQMTDADCSFGIVMGPKAEGVNSRFYADQVAINRADSDQVSDPGLGKAIHTYDSSVYFDSSGRGLGGQPVVGDLQAGAIRFLSEKMNSGMSLAELGNFIKIG